MSNEVKFEIYCRHCGNEIIAENPEFECRKCHSEDVFRTKSLVCSCGEKVYLTRNTNECNCGKMFNGFGQELAPVEEWDEEDRYETFCPQN